MSFYLRIGYGVDNCVTVKTDENGRMSIPELRKAIQTTLNEGKIPFMVGATAGKTVIYRLLIILIRM